MSKITKFANKAAFFFYLRINREKIIEGFRKWVEEYGLENMKATIRKGEFPAVAPDLFAKATDYMEYVDSISVEYLAELIVEAVPEIAEYLISLGPEGGVYLAKLRLHFLELCRHPEEAPVATITPNDSEFNIIYCDKCEKSFPVKKNELDKLSECPFCHAPAK
jgi:hypothetical protein